MYKNPKDPRQAEAQKKYYLANKEKYYQINKNKKASLLRFLEGLKSYPCEDCGASYPYYVMDLDHRPDEVKRSNVSQIVNHGSWNTLITEIMKCDLVCANCHRIRTFERSH